MVETGASGRTFPGFEDIDDNLVPDADDTHDLGSDTNRWAALYAVLAIITSMTLGGVYLYVNTDGYFVINASTQINGSLNVTGNITADYYFGNGSGLTGVTAVFDNTNIAYYNQSVNWSGNINATGYYIFADYFIGDGSRLTNLSFLSNSTFTLDQIAAITNATNPNASNYFATINDLTSGNLTIDIILMVRNDQGAQLNKGNPVYFSGFNAGKNITNVQLAINSDTHKYADCVIGETIATAGTGICVSQGHIIDFDTSEWNVVDELYLNATAGTYITTKPDAICIQEVADVLRSHATKGVIWVHGNPRCNDVPYNFSISGNISADHFFGNGSQLTGLPTDNASCNINNSINS